MQAGGQLGRQLVGRGPDRVTAVGEQIHLLLPVDRLRRLRAARWRVQVGEQVVIDRAWEPEDEGIVIHRPSAPGCWPIRSELFDRRGARLDDQAEASPWLQAIDARPTYAVDVDLVRARPSAALALTALDQHGHALVYLDLAAADRRVELRAQLAELGAPPAAILSIAEERAEVPTLGVDFRAVFLTVALCRLRGAGVRLVGLVSAAPLAATAAKRAGVERFEELNPVRRASAAHREAIARQPWSRTYAGRLDRMTRTRARKGNVCAVELDNRRGRQRLFAAIERARRTVHLQYYMVRDGVFGDQLAARLVGAARRGVVVRLLVDALYSVDGVAGATNALARGLMAEPGIHVVSAAPISSPEDLEPRVLKQRDHRKVVVVDGSVAFVGGRNACDEYYTGFDEVAITDWTPHGRIPWLDAHVEIRGPLVGTIERAFLSRWISAGGSPPAGGVEGVVDPPAAGPSRARLVLHEGVDDAAAMLAYEALIDGAEDHVWVVNDFPIVPSLQLALRRALGRGVRVRVLTGSAVPRRADGSFFDGPLHREAFEYMTKKTLEGLMRAGAEVWEYVAPPHPLIVCRGGAVRPYVHAKIVSVDGQAVSVGSANLDATASYWEREANVVVEDPQVTREVETQLARICDRSLRVDPRGEQWQREGLLRDLAAQLWPEALYS